jgi:hypothetical protein
MTRKRKPATPERRAQLAMKGMLAAYFKGLGFVTRGTPTQTAAGGYIVKFAGSGPHGLKRMTLSASGIETITQRLIEEGAK